MGQMRSAEASIPAPSLEAQIMNLTSQLRANSLGCPGLDFVDGRQVGWKMVLRLLPWRQQPAPQPTPLTHQVWLPS